jgi:nucleoside-diphosphate-sugar epimerase
MKTAILFGGSGYISRFLLKKLIENNLFDKYYVYDIKSLENFDDELKSKKIIYIKSDVRKKIDIPEFKYDENESWIFNFAAIHREPGHEYKEYFDTNISGAKNINKFAEETGISNILFTSSIAPYGRSKEQREESSFLYPETGYGISKALAEKIHENWFRSDVSRKLVIVRPSHFWTWRSWKCI